MVALPYWKNQTLTPNPNAIYLMLINTRDAGPIVLEIPPASSDGSIIGNLDDVWQVALEDIGTAGADKGKGGKYLILPPGYKQKIPAGCLPMPSDTYENYALVRSIPASGSEADVAKALAYGKRVKLYPLLQAANPPATTFVDATNVMFDFTIPYVLRIAEPHCADRAMARARRGHDRSAQVDWHRKGKPFNPDVQMQDTLKQAATEAHEWLDVRYESIFVPYFEGAHCSEYVPLAQQGMDFTAQYPTCTSPRQRFETALASGSARLRAVVVRYPFNV